MIKPLKVRALQHLGQRPVETFTIVEQQNSVCAEPRGKIDVVQYRDIEMTRSVRAFAQLIQYLDLVTEVEVIGRLVQQADRRILREQGSNFDSSPLATGECRERSGRKTRKADGLECGVGGIIILGAFPLPTCEARVTAGQHRFENRGGKRRFEILKQDTQLPGPLAMWHVVNVRVVEADVAGIRWTETG